MAERLILALLAISTVGVARVTGDCGKPPQLENGSPNDEYISLTSFPVGAKVRYRCDPGYMFQEGSSKPVTCKTDSTWTPLQAICEPRNCGNPGEILNGYYEATSTTFGSKATFYCDTGYHMVGTKYRKCEADGWSGQVPTCELVTCDDLPTISNGITPTPPNAENWEYGMVAEYSCIRGYTLIGAEALTCLETGEWDQPPPACKVVECQRPEISAHVHIKAGFGPKYKYRDTIQYLCDEGYKMVGQNIIKCTQDNTFVPSPPTCKYVTSSTTTVAIPSSTTTTTTTEGPVGNRAGKIVDFQHPQYFAFDPVAEWSVTRGHRFKESFVVLLFFLPSFCLEYGISITKKKKGHQSELLIILGVTTSDGVLI
ncbi:C4b-binding protein alpha chain-like isoform X3 [Heptranchias perlo]|uniref:C4b-binding protein alpha chain-like isoform X3 n=1 Tax=Heptranchias perlo TaxID=212740 RepID=UPI00355A114F